MVTRPFAHRLRGCSMGYGPPRSAAVDRAGRARSPVPARVRGHRGLGSRALPNSAAGPVLATPRTAPCRVVAKIPPSLRCRPACIPAAGRHRFAGRLAGMGGPKLAILYCAAHQAIKTSRAIMTDDMGHDHSIPSPMPRTLATLSRTARYCRARLDPRLDALGMLP